MQQQFFIKQCSTLPLLKMDLIDDGRNDFKKFHEAIQNCDITFTMKNIDTNVIKVANAKAYVMEQKTEGCVKKYCICYPWKERDTKEKGTFEGMFTLKFDGTLSSEYDTYPKGELIVPIREKLIIVIG